jgi:hypothetical protein
MKNCLLGVVLALISAAPASAEVISVDVRGKLDSVQYDFNGPASTLFLANVPFGSPYRFTFSYDTATTPTFQSPGGAYYDQPTINATFSLGGVVYNMPRGVSLSWSNGLGSPARFGVGGNFDFGPPLLNDFRAIDFSFVLYNLQSGVIGGPEVPRSLNFTDFTNYEMRTRFVGSRVGMGETGLLYSVDSFSLGVQAVPESATWLMMIAGFGIVGSGLRRRRTSIAGAQL